MAIQKSASGWAIVLSMAMVVVGVALLSGDFLATANHHEIRFIGTIGSMLAVGGILLLLGAALWSSFSRGP